MSKHAPPLRSPQVATPAAELRGLRYVEFRDGSILLQAVLDENVYPIVHRVSYRGRTQPAALAFSLEHPQLLIPARRDLLLKMLATHGGEPQMVAPRVPADSWMAAADAVLGLQLEPTERAGELAEVLLLLPDLDALRTVRALLLSFSVPFQLGLLGDNRFFITANLDRPGGGFIADVLRERQSATLLRRAWQTTMPNVAFFVESGYHHPCAGILHRLATLHGDCFTDWERLLCTAEGRLRVVIEPQALLSYSEAIRPIAATELSPAVRASAEQSGRILDTLARAELDRVEVRIERTARRRSIARRSTAVDTEAAMLRLELLRLSERLQELDHAAGRVPMIYGYCGSDNNGLRLLLRILPQSTKERLLCAALPARGDGSPWFFLLTAAPADMVRLPASGQQWVRFIGQCDASDPVPAVYIPDGYQLTPNLAAVGARRFIRLLDGHAAEDPQRRRILLPASAPADSAEQAPDERWQLLVLEPAACRPLLQGLSTLAEREWATLRAEAYAAPAVPPAASWSLSFNDYERELVTMVAVEVERLEARIRELLPKSERLVEEIGKRSSLLDELYRFEDKIKQKEAPAATQVLAELEATVRWLTGAQNQLADRLAEALTSRRRLDSVMAAAEQAVGLAKEPPHD